MAKWDLTRWQNERTTHWLVESWADGLLQVVSAASAGAPDIRVTVLPPDVEAWKQWKNALWVSHQAAGIAGGSLVVGCAGESEQALAALMGGEGLDAPSARQVYLGLVKHATESLGQAASGRFPQPVAFGEPAECPMPGFASLGVACHFALSGTAHTMALAPNEVLLAAILAEDRDSPGTALAELSSDAAIVPELALSPHARQNLEMLLDVDLELSVSFGRTSLLLQDVLKLSSGSIVELNRSASDPVDLLVNESVVARGEVVVVDGNYGIRITEIISPRDRIRSLL